MFAHVDMGDDENHVDVVSEPPQCVSSISVEAVTRGMNNAFHSLQLSDVNQVIDDNHGTCYHNREGASCDREASTSVSSSINDKLHANFPSVNMRNDIYDLNQSDIMAQIVKRRKSSRVAARVSERDVESSLPRETHVVVRTKTRYDKDLQKQYYEKLAKKARKHRDLQLVLNAEDKTENVHLGYNSAHRSYNSDDDDETG